MFSLMEVIIVITIIALIAALTVPRILGQSDEAKVQLTKTELSTLAGTIEQFKLNTGKLPESLNELVSNSRNLSNWKKLRDVTPKDAWNNEITFERSSSNRYGFKLKSLAADGLPGGDDLNYDIIFPEEIK